MHLLLRWHGYEDAIEETGRLTSKRREIDEELRTILDIKLQILKDKINLRPKVTFTYFVPDTKKDGGTYVTATGNVIKIDEYRQTIVMENRVEIRIIDIIKIEGEFFKNTGIE